MTAAVFLIAWLSRGWLSAAIAGSLVCVADAAPSDAILVENFDPDYLVFERATELRRAGLGSRVLVPVAAAQGETDADHVGLGLAGVMANLAQLDAMEIVPIREVEPISLNAARDVLNFMQAQRIRSVIVVTPLFRSQRSALVYRNTLTPAGITVRCEPVQAGRQIDNWTRTSHGVQDVVEQWIKLQYYRLYVLPLHRADEPVGRTSLGAQN